MFKKYWPLFVLLVVGCLWSSKQISKSFKVHEKADIVCPVTENKPFVIVIASYNNEGFCEKNLRSVCDQKYPNYRVIYIDDCSSDRTAEKVENYIAKEGKGIDIQLIKNSHRCGATENFYRAVRSCKENEIIVVLDGDDWFAHDWVLQKLNTVYANPDVWITYGSHLYYPSYKRGECSRKIPLKVQQENSLRKYVQKEGMITSHLRTFYAGLFNRIKLSDILLRGKFLESSSDAAFMLPMVEMAGAHTHFIKDILYIYNRTNPLSDDKVNFAIQQECWHHVQSLPPYDRLSALDLGREEAARADLIIFSYDRPLQLYACLESIAHYVNHTDRIQVIYRCSDAEFAKAYEEVHRSFPQVDFVKQSEHPHEDFKPLVLKAVFEGSSPYVIFAVDDIIVKDFIDFKDCIEQLKKTQAYGFYLRLGRHVDYCYMLDFAQGVPTHVALKDGLYAWQFEYGKGDWKYPHSLDMTLYKKADIQKDLNELSFCHPNSLEAAWAKKADLKGIGLFYENSKIVNIPLGIVNPSSNRHMNLYSTQDLLEKFKDGLKINIVPLFQIDNHSAHLDYEPEWIAR